MENNTLRQEWLIIANPEVYQHHLSFKINGHIDWKQDVLFSVGDIVYVYVASGSDNKFEKSEIKYRCIVEKINISIKDPDWTDDKLFWNKQSLYLYGLKGLYVRIKPLQIASDQETRLILTELFRHGLNFVPKGGAKKITSPELSLYLNNVFGTQNEFQPLKKNRNIPSHIRIKVFKRDLGKCRICASTENLHFDHIHPFSKGGSSIDPDNIQLLCQKCNLTKGNRIQ
jgi:hypothetical protein